jgi:hypothetical protein
MNLYKLNYRATVTNYKRESRVEKTPVYINPEKITKCLEFGDVVRICFADEGDYLEVDRLEFEGTFSELIK